MCVWVRRECCFAVVAVMVAATGARVPDWHGVAAVMTAAVAVGGGGGGAAAVAAAAARPLPLYRGDQLSIESTAALCPVPSASALLRLRLVLKRAPAGCGSGERMMKQI